MTSAADRELLLSIARHAIAAHVGAQAPFAADKRDVLSRQAGVFVSIHRRGDLRGCIGHISACLPLVETVKDAALASAFNDPRFPALTAAEWPHVSIEISVLSRFELAADPSCVSVGIHGVMIRSGRHSGLLLPQVATEYGWDRETFLGQACRKAGLPEDAWRGPGTTIETFTATVFHEPE